MPATALGIQPGEMIIQRHRITHNSDLAAEVVTGAQAADLSIQPGSTVTIGRNCIYDTNDGVIECGGSCSVAGRWLTYQTPL